MFARRYSSILAENPDRSRGAVTAMFSVGLSLRNNESKKSNQTNGKSSGHVRISSFKNEAILSHIFGSVSLFFFFFPTRDRPSIPLGSFCLSVHEFKGEYECLDDFCVALLFPRFSL